MNLESLTNVNRCEASAPSVLYTYKYMHLRLFRIEESSSWFALHQSCRIAQYRRAKPPRRRSSRQESSYGMNLLCFQVFFPLDYDFSRSRFRLESNNARTPVLLDSALVGIFWNHHFLFACTWTGQDITRYDDEEHLKAAGKYLLAFNGKPYPSSEPGQVFERAGTGGEERPIREKYIDRRTKRRRTEMSSTLSLFFYTFKKLFTGWIVLWRLVFLKWRNYEACNAKDNDDSELSSGWIKGGELVERII